MAIIKPFRALRPRPEKAKEVSCVPYDVVYEGEVRAFVEENPLSFLRVTRPESDFTEEENPSVEMVFERARTNLDWFINEKIFETDGENAFYIYELADRTHTQTGIVGCCSLDEYELGLIKKHENVRPDKVEERTEHLLAVRAQTGLIFLAFRGTDRTRELIATAVKNDPIYAFTCPDGIRQRVWRVSETGTWIEAFGKIPAIYIADGHHRVESAKLARNRLREQNPLHNGEEDYNFVVAGIFPAEDLRILAYNRIVKDMNGLSEEELLARAGESFEVTETNQSEPKSRGEFCMYIGEKWYTLRPKNQIAQTDPVRRLDVSILQEYVLGPILGIEDPRTDTRIGFVGGKRGTDELEKLVDEGDAKIAFSMFPTTMDDLLTVSDAGEIMPPKSTWFEPKLKDGLLVHMIDSR